MTGRAPFVHWCEIVSGILVGYCGRTLADLPHGVALWLLWAYQGGQAARDSADFLSLVHWGDHVTLDRDPVVPTHRRALIEDLRGRIAA